eukprot:972487-Rhodomonas_salina.2
MPGTDIGCGATRWWGMPSRTKPNEGTCEGYLVLSVRRAKSIRDDPCDVPALSAGTCQLCVSVCEEQCIQLLINIVKHGPSSFSSSSSSPINMAPPLASAIVPLAAILHKRTGCRGCDGPARIVWRTCKRCVVRISDCGMGRMMRARTWMALCSS